MRIEQSVKNNIVSANLPRLDSSLSACVRWRYADLADVLRAQLAILDLERRSARHGNTKRSSPG